MRQGNSQSESSPQSGRYGPVRASSRPVANQIFRGFGGRAPLKGRESSPSRRGSFLGDGVLLAEGEHVGAGGLNPLAGLEAVDLHVQIEAGAEVLLQGASAGAGSK